MVTENGQTRIKDRVSFLPDPMLDYQAYERVVRNYAHTVIDFPYRGQQTMKAGFDPQRQHKSDAIAEKGCTDISIRNIPPTNAIKNCT